MKQPGRVFISYRRDGGDGLAGRVRDALVQRGFSVFLDVEDLKTGKFNEALLHEIEACSDFIVILSSGALDRCMNEGDWVRLEIAHALKLQKNIVPVFGRNFQFPATALPPEIDELRHFNGIHASHDLFEASMTKLAGLLRGSRRIQARRTRLGLFAAVVLLALCGVLWTQLPGLFTRAEAPARQTLTLADQLTAADLLSESIIKTLGLKGLLYSKEGPITLIHSRTLNNTQFALDTGPILQRMQTRLAETGAFRIPGNDPLATEIRVHAELQSGAQEQAIATQPRVFSLLLTIGQTPVEAGGFSFAFNGSLTSTADGLVVWQDIAVIE